MSKHVCGFFSKKKFLVMPFVLSIALKYVQYWINSGKAYIQKVESICTALMKYVAKSFLVILMLRSENKFKSLVKDNLKTWIFKHQQWHR